MATSYDILVIGGGHAGAEAAWAAARLGARTAMVTMDRLAIGRMSCNPAIGGLGKGQMVREIDAMGGLMGLAADAGGIQFRMLNSSKGPAVWGPRAQSDRVLYCDALRGYLENERNLEIVEGEVSEISTVEATNPSGVPCKRVAGVVLADGRSLPCDAAILTTGTFMAGLMHCGEEQTPGGRIGEPASVGLSDNLKSLGFEIGRLKTGTPPRVHCDTLDYDVLQRQDGDEEPIPFSFMNDRIEQKQIPCWITYTSQETHELIRQNLDRAPMYTGQIHSTGPRYCPSIEDKIVRFPDRPRHQVFLEPEGYDTEWIYCNGISTSLPRDVQHGMLRSIKGLENAKILQYAYAIEYDFLPTWQLRPNGESKPVSGLFLAGQVNGTSGYEEAAGQGLVAGVNAVARLKGQEPLVLRRDQSYIGVMMDDLVTKPPTEPYRMFTSRAEYRLALRSDNADTRLTPIGREIGLVDDKRWQRFEAKQKTLKDVRAATESIRVGQHLLIDLMKRPDTQVETVVTLVTDKTGEQCDPDIAQQILIDCRYEGYLNRQKRQIEKLHELESMRIPGDLDYSSLTVLRTEARQILSSMTPETLAQAGRIPGITPADLASLWVYLGGRNSPSQGSLSDSLGADNGS